MKKKQLTDDEFDQLMQRAKDSCTEMKKKQNNVKIEDVLF
jgi:hypothetical protein